MSGQEGIRKKRKHDNEVPILKRIRLETDKTKYNGPCPICLNPMKNRIMGTPINCSHNYCLRCIRQWSRRKNTCPFCRRTYTAISVSRRATGKLLRQIPVSETIWDGNEDNSTHFTVFAVMSRLFVNFMRKFAIK